MKTNLEVQKTVANSLRTWIEEENLSFNESKNQDGVLIFIVGKVGARFWVDKSGRWDGAENQSDECFELVQKFHNWNMDKFRGKSL